MDEFRKVVEKYRGKVMALAMNVLGNRQDAEDACQDTFIHVYRSLDTFDTTRSFRTWIYAILFNLCRDQLRKRQRFIKFFKKAKAESLVSQQSHTMDNSSHQFFQRNILKNLTPKERAALYLWAVEGCTSEETGSVLACSASTARVHLYNARRKIKAALEEKNVSM